MFRARPGLRWRLAASAFFMVVLVSGCLGDGGGALVPAPSPSHMPPPAEERPVPEPDAVAVALAPFRFPLDAPLDVVHWENGSFDVEETGLGGGFVSGDFVKVVDLSPHLPADVPILLDVQVKLDAESIPLVGPTARADPVSNGTVWYASSWTLVEPGLYQLHAVVQRRADGWLGIALEAYTLGVGEPPHVNFAVRAAVQAWPAQTPAGVPVALTVTANETLTFAGDPETFTEVLVFGPDDRILDRLFFRGAQDWRAKMDAEIVVMPLSGAQGLQVLGVEQDETRTLRALALQRESGPVHVVPPQENVTWTFDVGSLPLRLLVTVVGPANEPWLCYGVLGVRLEGPTERLIDGAADCPSPTNVPFLYEEQRVWTTELGDNRLVPGTYTARVENSLWHGHVAFHSIERYVR